MTPAAPHQVGKVYLLNGQRFLCLKVHPYPDHKGPNLYQSIDKDGKPITEKMNYGGVRPMLNLIFHQIPNMVKETNTPPSKYVHRYARPENEFDEMLSLVPINVTEQDFLAMAACNIAWHSLELSTNAEKALAFIKENNGAPDYKIAQHLFPGPKHKDDGPGFWQHVANLSGRTQEIGGIAYTPTVTKSYEDQTFEVCQELLNTGKINEHNNGFNNYSFSAK